MNNKLRQLSLFETDVEDNRPLPLIISTLWSFSLQYQASDGKTYYAVQDWIAGLATCDSKKAANTWQKLKIQTVISNHPLQYQASDGKTYIRDFTDDNGLYQIATLLRSTKSRPALQAIKDYLAKAGVWVDRQRTDSNFAQATIKALEHRHQLRQDSVKERKQFAQVARDTHISNRPQYGVLTNMVYFKIARTSQPHTAKKEIIAVLGLTDKQARNFRDHLNELVLSAITMAESAASMKMQDEGRLLSDSEQLAIVMQCARIAAVSAHQLADYIGKDLLTGKPLLGS